MWILSILFLAIFLCNPTEMTASNNDGAFVMSFTPQYLHQLPDEDLQYLDDQETKDINESTQKDDQLLRDEFSSCMSWAAWYDKGSRILGYIGKGASSAVSIVLGQIASFGLPQDVVAAVNYGLSVANGSALAVQVVSSRFKKQAGTSRARATDIFTQVHDSYYSKPEKTLVDESITATQPNAATHMMLVRRGAHLGSQNDQEGGHTNKGPPPALRFYAAMSSAPGVNELTHQPIPKKMRQEMTLNSMDQEGHDWKQREYDDIYKDIKRADWWSKRLELISQIGSGANTVGLALASALKAPTWTNYVFAGLNGATIVIQHIADNLRVSVLSDKKKLHKKETSDKENRANIKHELDLRKALRDAQADTPVTPAAGTGNSASQNTPSNSPQDPGGKGKEEDVTGGFTPVVAAAGVTPPPAAITNSVSSANVTSAMVPVDVTPSARTPLRMGMARKKEPEPPTAGPVASTPKKKMVKTKKKSNRAARIPSGTSPMKVSPAFQGGTAEVPLSPGAPANSNQTGDK
jgi:hypothetical protein